MDFIFSHFMFFFKSKKEINTEQTKKAKIRVSRTGVCWELGTEAVKNFETVYMHKGF